VTLSFTILAVFVACLRLLTRFFVSNAAGADDAFVATSTVSIPRTFPLGTFAHRFRSSQLHRLPQFVFKVGQDYSSELPRCSHPTVKYGLSQHLASLSKHEVLWTTIWFWNTIWIYQGALSAAKMSILLQYRRIFS
jgi:hypothetical protein